MSVKVTKDLQKIERAMNKLRNKLKRADLDYTVQLSISSITPTKVVYAAQMTALQNGLRPATFISHNGPEELVAQIKEFTKSLDWDKLEIAYHKGQISAAESTIRGHEEAIKDIEESSKPSIEEPVEEVVS